MRTTREVRHIMVSIDRPPKEVYAFVSNPGNTPKCATGLGDSIKQEGYPCSFMRPPASVPGKARLPYREKSGNPSCR